MIEDKTLNNYLKEIAKYPMLSREDERSLAIRAQAGDQVAKEKLINSNLRFVVKIASKYQNRGLSLSELISEGNLGLITAINKFDYKKDFKLISYAVWWIKQSIISALNEKTSLIRVPIFVSRKVAKIKSCKMKSQMLTGGNTSNQQIDELANNRAVASISVDDIDYISKKSEHQVRFLFEDFQNTEQTTIHNATLRRTINNSLKSLNEREALIIKLYFGLDGNREMTYREIAEVIGISRERVRQLQKLGLKKILKMIYLNNEDDNFYA